LALAALVTLPAQARPKSQNNGVSCSCTCESDARGSGFFPIASSDATFTADDRLDCEIGGGDCAVRLGNGKTLPGTLHHCSVGSGSGSASLSGPGIGKGILTNPVGNAPPLRQSPIPFRPIRPPHRPLGSAPIIQ
jgi:hypothetical protein